MFNQRTRNGVKKILAITAASTMFSMFGSSISIIEAASAPGVYVTPKNSVSSDIISIDWSPVQTAPYTYWAAHNWNQGEKLVGMLDSNNKAVLMKMESVLCTLQFGILFLLRKQ